MTTINQYGGQTLNHHILSVLVQNRPGVLARVAGLFARRGYNIFSLAVAPAEDEGMSRITIVVDVESTPLEQITKQLFKLIDVVKISELDPRRSVERELLIATVRAPDEQRAKVVELVNIFEGKIIAVAESVLTVSLEGHPDKLDDFEDLLDGYGIVELQRTGRVASAETRSRCATARRAPHSHNWKGRLRWLSPCITPRMQIPRSSAARRSPSSATARRATPTRST